jgi:hypothetical protein
MVDRSPHAVGDEFLFEVMKNWIQLARITVTLLAGCFGLAWLTGCESLQDTSFAPLDARLEPIPGGGAQHFIVVNTSGQVLHNFRFRAYMWDDRAITYTAGNNSPFPKRLPAMTYTFMGSGSQWEPGHVQRFRDRDLNSEISILKPVSRVQIVGRCDEGRFREDWRITGSGQLQQIGRSQIEDGS